MADPAMAAGLLRPAGKRARLARSQGLEAKETAVMERDSESALGQDTKGLTV